MRETPHIAVKPLPGTTPEAELSVLAAVYKFVLFESQANKGGPYGLTGHPTKECTTRPDKKGKENADLHGD